MLGWDDSSAGAGKAIQYDFGWGFLDLVCECGGGGVCAAGALALRGKANREKAVSVDRDHVKCIKTSQ